MPKSKHKGANDTPARQRYWQSGRLMQRKVRNLMRHCGLSESAAVARWLRDRKGRKK